MRDQRIAATIRGVQAVRLSVNIGLRSYRDSHCSRSSLSGLSLEKSGTALLAVVLEVRRDPPAGRVQMGSRQWRFANRVELLEAIDAAYARAMGVDLDP